MHATPTLPKVHLCPRRCRTGPWPPLIPYLSPKVHRFRRPYRMALSRLPALYWSRKARHYLHRSRTDRSQRNFRIRRLRTAAAVHHQAVGVALFRTAVASAAARFFPISSMPPHFQGNAGCPTLGTLEGGVRHVEPPGSNPQCISQRFLTHNLITPGAGSLLG
jgi:hypothetical protein